MNNDHPGQRATGCPHAWVQYCPLMIAAHIPGGGGCNDGKLDHGGCAVDRGLDYATAVAKVEARFPEMVRERRSAEKVRRFEEQRNRNLTLNGIH